MAKKTDLRVVKTKKALSSAMLMLLRDMPFAKITVNEICARALVSRSAFYTHFLDKYDLAVYCLDDVSAQLFDMVQEQSVQAQLRSLIENIRQNSRLFENLLMADYDAELMEILRKGFLRKFYKQQEKIGEIINFPHPPEISATFCAAGFTGAIMLWIRGNMQYTVDEMADCLRALLPK
jgi:AcrR family transcriptional regulator